MQKECFASSETQAPFQQRENCESQCGSITWPQYLTWPWPIFPKCLSSRPLDQRGHYIYEDTIF